ncbi:MAG: hypothetical protein RBU37_01230 [Myxococcota bacterium]|jgi:hypothetical protein|nr:hypothetical protein [Myxococcota bacterium]
MNRLFRYPLRLLASLLLIAVLLSLPALGLQQDNSPEAEAHLSPATPGQRVG